MNGDGDDGENHADDERSIPPDRDSTLFLHMGLLPVHYASMS